MPLINGIKMACEPCIRGHRSTKCTHANERLMVPVRKPGRPLSACPHPYGQRCSCSNVTTAIPKKQTCHCGSKSVGAGLLQALANANENNVEPTSPNRSAFRVQKTLLKPTSGRNLSVDLSSIERMDMNSINVVSFDQQQTGTMSQPLTYDSSYATLQVQNNLVPALSLDLKKAEPLDDQDKGIESTTERFDDKNIHTPAQLTTSAVSETNGKSCCSSSSATSTDAHGQDNIVSQGRSCCGSKRLEGNKSHNNSRPSLNTDTLANGSQAQDSSVHIPGAKPGSFPILKTSLMAPQIPYQAILPNGMIISPAAFSQYLPSSAAFADTTAAYGSFQNPLQPIRLRQGLRAAPSDQQQLPVASTASPFGELSFKSIAASGDIEIVHNCNCGDTCQCIGCASYPYNDATQEYVRSAYYAMATDTMSGTLDDTTQTLDDTNHTSLPGETIRNRSLAQTSTSTTANPVSGEEQSFSASDFLFVNFPFSSEAGCGGDTDNCPCGDDCQCLGCTIHSQPATLPSAIPCTIEGDMCPCGDDCACIGCEIHGASILKDGT